MPDSFRPRSVLMSFRFLAPSLIGSLVMALVGVFAPLEAQLAVLGALVSILGGLFISYVEQEAERDRGRMEILKNQSVPMQLANDPELLAQYTHFCQVMTDLSQQPDPILRETALLKLASINNQISPLSAGTVVFEATEGWRTVYERLLASPDLKEYRSVACVRSKDYWQDAPGLQSMKANYDALLRGVRIERIVIIKDEFWPANAHFPVTEIRTWIDHQHNHGIWLMLAREKDLTNEPDLRADFGIYGNRAVGTQELDDRSRTTRFTLSFDPSVIRLSNDRWQRLYLFGISYQTLLDRAPPVA